MRKRAAQQHGAKRAQKDAVAAGTRTGAAGARAGRGVAREGRERGGVRGCTGPRGGREGAQHESAQTAEGTQKARGSARQERERTREAGGGDANVRVADLDFRVTVAVSSFEHFCSTL